MNASRVWASQMREKATGDEVAVKFIPRPILAQLVKLIQREIEIQAQVCARKKFHSLCPRILPAAPGRVAPMASHDRTVPCRAAG